MEILTERLSFNSCERSEHNSFSSHWHFAVFIISFIRQRVFYQCLQVFVMTLGNAGRLGGCAFQAALFTIRCKAISSPRAIAGDSE